MQSSMVTSLRQLFLAPAHQWTFLETVAELLSHLRMLRMALFYHADCRTCLQAFCQLLLQNIWQCGRRDTLLQGIDGMFRFNRRDLKFETDAEVFAAADPDNDGILDKNELLDAGHDGTIDAKELKSSAGLSLMLLLK
jgi:hypothetical protein